VGEPVADEPEVEQGDGQEQADDDVHQATPPIRRCRTRLVITARLKWPMWGGERRVRQRFIYVLSTLEPNYVALTRAI
jgi:hypothetical protein